MTIMMFQTITLICVGSLAINTIINSLLTSWFVSMSWPMNSSISSFSSFFFPHPVFDVRHDKLDAWWQSCDEAQPEISNCFWPRYMFSIRQLVSPFLHFMFLHLPIIQAGQTIESTSLSIIEEKKSSPLSLYIYRYPDELWALSCSW